MSDPCCRSVEPELQGILSLADSLYMMVKIKNHEFSLLSRSFIYSDDFVKLEVMTVNA